MPVCIIIAMAFASYWCQEARKARAAVDALVKACKP